MANTNLKTNKEFIDPTQLLGIYRNPIINGGMRISQRGDFTVASAAADSTFYLDRMCVFLVSGVTANKQHTTVGAGELPLSKCPWAFKLIATNTVTARYGVYQRLEQLEEFRDKIITFSAFVKSNNSNTRLRIHDGIGYSYSVAASSGAVWQWLTVTHSVNSAATAIRLSVTQDNGSVGDVAVTSGDYLETTGWNLNIGSSAISYQAKLLNEELMDCLRFYEKSYDYGTNPGSVTWSGICDSFPGTATTNNIGCNVWFKVPKRSTGYNIYSWDDSGNAAKCYKGASNKSRSIPLQNEYGFWWRTNDATNANEAAMHWAAEDEVS